ncbi:hypothetical protein HDU98_007452 [Podochytrium sp. JEL0797]|nr:hypothetical protein HDU98_007452 [Podochytrium sp. JEL0797]
MLGPSASAATTTARMAKGKGKKEEPPSLQYLPREILLMIFEYVTKRKTLEALANSCVTFNLCATPLLYKHIRFHSTLSFAQFLQTLCRPLNSRLFGTFVAAVDVGGSDEASVIASTSLAVRAVVAAGGNIALVLRCLHLPGSQMGHLFRWVLVRHGNNAVVGSAARPFAFARRCFCEDSETGGAARQGRITEGPLYAQYGGPNGYVQQVFDQRELALAANDRITPVLQPAGSSSSASQQFGPFCSPPDVMTHEDEFEDFQISDARLNPDLFTPLADDRTSRPARRRFHFGGGHNQQPVQMGLVQPVQPPNANGPWPYQHLPLHQQHVLEQLHQHLQLDVQGGLQDIPHGIFQEHAQPQNPVAPPPHNHHHHHQNIPFWDQFRPHPQPLQQTFPRPFFPPPASKTVTAGSLFLLATHCPNLKSLNLAYSTILPDTHVVETNEFQSMLFYNPEGLTLEKIEPIDGLCRLLESCPKLINLDLAGCGWLSVGDVNRIVAVPGLALKALNLVGCARIPVAIQKLFVVEQCEELKALVLKHAG